MALPSLRSRVVIGAALWTIGLFFLVSMGFVHIMTVSSRGLYTIHRVLEHIPIVGSLALACILAGAWQVRKGLSTVLQIRDRLSSVHRGETPRLTGTYSSEVQPLVDDLNALLDQRERAVQRAVAKAGDLAHGLKTPLAVLSQEAQRAERAGHADIAAAVGREIQRMQAQIDYHLAHARAAASGAAPGVRAVVKTSADALSRTLLQLHADRGLTIDVRIPPDHAVQCQREDLEEMLGNLVDNACKWARTHVTIASADSGTGSIVIAVDDDGPGLEQEMRTKVLQRGVRADEAVPGTGLGLAIARDLADLCRGSIRLDASPEGGVRARLELPAAGGVDDAVTKR